MTSNTDADAHLDALRYSVDRLRHITSAMTDPTLSSPAYPSEWSIAQVLSHLGSAAVIMQRRLEDTLTDRPTPDDFAPSVWDTWNAETPSEQRDDALATDAALLARVEAVTAEGRTAFAFSMGPITVGFTHFVDLRINEHAMHTWDIEVAINPAATIPSRLAALVVDNLELIARYTGKPTGETATITGKTAEPARGFTIELTSDSVAFAASDPVSDAEVELPAEAFARLVYGRLDIDHTPPGTYGPALGTLRRAFPGP
jgi:uncharacterized protein (TIGR03083 family)